MLGSPRFRAVRFCWIILSALIGASSAFLARAVFISAILSGGSTDNANAPTFHVLERGYRLPSCVPEDY